MSKNKLSLELPNGDELVIEAHRDERYDWTIRVEAWSDDGLRALPMPSRLWMTQFSLFYALRSTATPTVFERGDSWYEFSVQAHSVPTALRELSGILEVTLEQAETLKKVNARR